MQSFLKTPWIQKSTSQTSRTVEMDTASDNFVKKPVHAAEVRITYVWVT